MQTNGPMYRNITVKDELTGPAVVAALNKEVTRLVGKRPSVTQNLSSTGSGRPVGLREQKLSSGVGIRYLYQPGKLESGRRRATDPRSSMTHLPSYK